MLTNFESSSGSLRGGQRKIAEGGVHNQAATSDGEEKRSTSRQTSSSSFPSEEDCRQLQGSISGDSCGEANSQEEGRNAASSTGSTLNIKRQSIASPPAFASLSFPGVIIYGKVRG